MRHIRHQLLGHRQYVGIRYRIFSQTRTAITWSGHSRSIIHIDSLQMIQDKCVSIENEISTISVKCDDIAIKVDNLNSNSHDLATQFDMDDERLTQQLRDREPSPITQNVAPSNIGTALPVPIVSPNNHSRPPSQSNNTALQKKTHLLGSKIQHDSYENHYHLSPIDVNVTPDNITDYIAENVQANKDHIRIHRLMRRGQDISTLSYVTFKIETNRDIGHLITQPNFWPRHIIIKPWIKKDSTTSASSFLDNPST